MSTEPSDDSSEKSLATSISGGVNVDAQHDVNIGGDVVGRDKVTQNTWIRQVIMSPWAWIGGVIVLAVGLIVVSIIFNVGPLRALLPTPTLLPTPLAFASAAEGQSLIIVADFEDRSGGKYQGVDPAQYIYEKLTAQSEKDNLDIRIERLRHTVDDGTVRPTGETYSATLVLWGWYDTLSITPRVERIRLGSNQRSTNEGQHFILADPTQVEVSIVTRLPVQATYLTFFILGVDKLASTQAADAVTYFESALQAAASEPESLTDPSEAYFYHAKALYEIGENKRALSDYSKAIQLQPTYVAAYNNRGVIYWQAGDFENAAMDFNQAIQLSPDYYRAYNNRGLLFTDQQQYEDALTDFDRVIELNPENPEALNNRGLVYSKLGNYQQAIRDFSAAIQINPDLSVLFSNRGETYIHTGNYDQAVADLSRVLQLKPKDADAYNNRGFAYYSEGDYQRAIGDFDKAIELAPNNSVIYANRALVYKAIGEQNKSIADFSKVLELNPDPAAQQWARDQIRELEPQ